MKTVIMAGGKGTRISSVASDIPKPMIKIEGKPVLEHALECLRAVSYTHKQFISNEIFVRKLVVGRIRLQPLLADSIALTLVLMVMRYCQSSFLQSVKGSLIII